MPTLNVTLNDKTYAVRVPDEMLTDAEDFFRKMDSDMDRGWQMSRDFIEHPDKTQRAQIAAHRIMLAMSASNETMAQLMAGYILKRLPGVTGVVVDTDGEMLNTEIVYGAGATSAPAASGKLSRIEAMKQAGKEVTAVYKSGKSFRFAVLDRATGQWVESAALDDEKDAQERRMQAFKQRFEEISG
ncbi:MAG: hypothetical protein EPN55_01280 [Gammaproteobacteria bacterium]|nr:MAG: hypothetical protein EPN55_01280 [Gammaproteobacteria bacterium]